jgi:predicted Fe-S protein YdhL (DUF1289 family)
MSEYNTKTKLNGMSSSLEDSPCISVCNLSYGCGDKCVCGRNFKQVCEWNKYDTVQKKIIVMNAIEDADSFPRQKLTFLADEYGISMDAAKKIFVIDRLEDNH